MAFKHSSLMSANIRTILFSFLTVYLFNSGFHTVFAQTKEDCLNCHSDSTMTMEKSGKQVSIFVNSKVLDSSVHGKLNCTKCHTGFDMMAVPHKEKIIPIDCKSCHKDAEKKHSFHPQFMSIKTDRADVSCKNCHGTHNVSSPKSKASNYNVSNLSESCGKCHSLESARFQTSAHNRALKNGVKDAPNCITCHKTPVAPKAGRNTLDVKRAQIALCTSCHIDNPNTQKGIASVTFVRSYEKSVHGNALKNGNVNAPTCVDCHDPHNSEAGSNPKSSTFKANIVNTCGKCHKEIAAQYKSSIHGQSFAKGNFDSPACTDCHGEHNILAANNPSAKVNFKNVASQVCSPCHSSVRLTEKYGMNSDRIKTFKESYHGLALDGGSTTVANCASCHGVHNIKTSSDPASTINKNNIAKTCGSCHPGANRRFAEGKIHVSTSDPTDPILYWISNSYIILIFMTIGTMFFHNALDFYRKSRIKYLKKRGIIKPEIHGHSLYLRMSFFERIQHAALFTSFFTLVITGFMLRFPNAWWVSDLRAIIPNAFIIRSNLHRIAAVVMVTTSLMHIIYLAVSVRGRKLFFDLIPKLQDMKDAIGMFKYNIGISKVKPKLDRFSYIEKAEYWALIWGTVVMTITGLMMWFENVFIGSNSKLGWDIARTIHYYEAWLAFLSILVWHFYFVMLNPEVFPLSMAWLKGTISEEEMAEEHPLELERVIRVQHKENFAESDSTDVELIDSEQSPPR